MRSAVKFVCKLCRALPAGSSLRRCGCLPHEFSGHWSLRQPHGVGNGTLVCVPAQVTSFLVHDGFDVSWRLPGVSEIPRRTCRWRCRRARWTSRRTVFGRIGSHRGPRHGGVCGSAQKQGFQMFAWIDQHVPVACMEPSSPVWKPESGSPSTRVGVDEARPVSGCPVTG